MQQASKLAERAQQSAGKISAESAGAGSTAISWIDELLAKLHAIYGQKWAQHVAGVPYPALRATWAEALAGWSKAEAKMALDHCRDTTTWPPTVPDFLAARRAGMTHEQAVMARRLAEADSERLALPSRTWADSRADGMKQAQELLAGLRVAEHAELSRVEDDDDGEPTPDQICARDRERERALAAIDAMQREMAK